MGVPTMSAGDQRSSSEQIILNYNPVLPVLCDFLHKTHLLYCKIQDFRTGLGETLAAELGQEGPAAT